MAGDGQSGHGSRTPRGTGDSGVPNRRCAEWRPLSTAVEPGRLGLFSGGLVLTAPSRQDGCVDLSVVIPCYNEVPRLRPTLERLRPHLDGMGRPYEVIFVDDGSRDGTLLRLREAAGA